jgi:glutathione S-transferase
MSEDLVLYGNHTWESPYVFSSFVVLQEKGIPCRVELIDLDRRQHETSEYRDRSITGRVPALRHGEFWLAESSAIDEYLDEAFPPPRWPRLYPEDLRERARVRMVQAFLRSDLTPLRSERPTSSFFDADPVKALSPEARASAERFLRIADGLVPSADGFVASRFSPADPDLALMIQRLAANGDPVPAKLKGYATAIWSRPSVRAWLKNTRWKGP